MKASRGTVILFLACVLFAPTTICILSAMRGNWTWAGVALVMIVIFVLWLDSAGASTQSLMSESSKNYERLHALQKAHLHAVYRRDYRAADAIARREAELKRDLVLHREGWLVHYSRLTPYDCDMADGETREKVEHLRKVGYYR